MQTYIFSTLSFQIYGSLEKSMLIKHLQYSCKRCCNLAHVFGGKSILMEVILKKNKTICQSEIDPIKKWRDLRPINQCRQNIFFRILLLFSPLPPPSSSQRSKYLNFWLSSMDFIIMKLLFHFHSRFQFSIKNNRTFFLHIVHHNTYIILYSDCSVNSPQNLLSFILIGEKCGKSHRNFLLIYISSDTIELD